MVVYSYILIVIISILLPYFVYVTIARADSAEQNRRCAVKKFGKYIKSELQARKKLTTIRPLTGKSILL